MGYARGPRIGVILEELKIQRLDGFLKTREDEAAYVQSRFPSEENKGE